MRVTPKTCTRFGPGIAVCLLYILSALPAFAQNTGITLKVDPSLEGNFKIGEWLPLRVTLSNQGAARNVNVRVSTTSSSDPVAFSAPVELPPGAEKRITLYVRPPSFASALRVRVMEGAQEVANARVTVTPQQNVNYIIGVIAPSAGGFTGLNGMALAGTPSRPVKIIPITLADISERPEGMRSLDALVITGVDTSALTAAQKDGLSAWVQQGGRLILGGGASAARTLSGLNDSVAANLHPLETVELTTLPALGEYGGETVRVAGPFTASTIQGDHTLLEQDGRPLVVENRIGTGMVTYVALDPASSPFDAWAGTRRFWQLLVAPGSAYPQDSPLDVSPRALHAFQMSWVLQNLPTLALPSIDILVALLGAYILLIGPINYLVLRRLKKLEWGWVTIPALTLLFAAGAFLISYSLRGTRVILNHLAVITLDGKNSSAQTWIGLFSPDKNTYTLLFPENTLITPVSSDWGGSGWGGFGSGASAFESNAEIVQSNPTQVRDVNVVPGAQRAFYAETAPPASWQVESALSLDGNHVKGTITNKTSETLSDLILVQRLRYMQLDDLQPGETRTLDSAWSQTTNPFPYFISESIRNRGSAAGRETDLKTQVIENYFQNPSGLNDGPDQPLLLGWIKTSPLLAEVAQVPSEKIQTSLVVAPLSFKLRPGAVKIPRGYARVTQVDGEIDRCGDDGRGFRASNPAVLELHLPDEWSALTPTAVTLWVRLNTPKQVMPKIKVETRDGKTTLLDAPNAGAVTIPNAANALVNGVMRLQIDPPGTGTPCAYYDLAVEGDIK